MSDRQVRLVCGPPCAGKSTYVETNARPGDLVVDYDDIARSLGSPRTHGHEFKYHAAVEAVIANCLDAIKSGKHDRAWVIRSAPSSHYRAALAADLGAEVVFLDAPDDVLIARAQTRRDPGKTVRAIRDWRRAAD